MWVSTVGGSGRRAVILRARMIVFFFFDASSCSVHWRRHFFQGSTECAREKGAHGQTFHLKLYGCSRMELGQECRALQKVSLCDATICVVASDFFVASLARRPMGGHQPILINLVRIGCDIAEKFQRSASKRCSCWQSHLA